MSTPHSILPTFRGQQLEHLSWPLGGVGAPLLAITGAGGIDRIAIRHRPDHRGMSFCFAALSFPGTAVPARVLEGPVPRHKSFTAGRSSGFNGSCGFGSTGGIHHGLPRTRSAVFTHRFPFANVDLEQPGWPVTVRLTAWSPFVAGDADASGMPVAALEYEITNPGRRRLRPLFSFHAMRDLLRDRGADPKGERIRHIERGFAIDYPPMVDKPWTQGGLAVEIDGAMADCAWFRGGWFDPLSMIWKRIEQGLPEANDPHPGEDPGNGASLWLPVDLPPRFSSKVTVRLAWRQPESDQWHGPARPAGAEAYRPREATLYPSAEAAADDFHRRYNDLRASTEVLATTLTNTDVPREIYDAVTATLPVLRSPTVLRQHDGRMWAWEGSGVDVGSCHGTCTHVWNYAQAVAHLFPELERGLRETEFGEGQDDHGHQNFRAALPIRPTDHGFHAAADGQLGGIIKVWRDWQISGDTAWLKRWWPRIKNSLEYCIKTWDPDRTGVLVEPHHNTYDIEFWGPDGMCGSFYAGALKAAASMAKAIGEDPSLWTELEMKAVRHLERDLYDHGRFVQHVQRSSPRTGDVASQKSSWNVNYSPEALALLDRGGPKYQYGNGVLSDGVIGSWLADVSGLGSPLDPAKISSHLKQIHRHNLRRDLRDFPCPQRPGFAIGDEGGLLLCTWPDGDRPELPFVYSDEVWTGIEHQVASHCVALGLVKEGLDILRTCRSRYDGTRRNPFDEYECGHWYARSLASWAFLTAHSGVRYSAVDKTLWIAPQTVKRPYRAPLVVGGVVGSITLTRTHLSLALQLGQIAVDTISIYGRSLPWKVLCKAGETKSVQIGGKETSKNTRPGRSIKSPDSGLRKRR